MVTGAQKNAMAQIMETLNKISKNESEVKHVIDADIMNDIMERFRTSTDNLNEKAKTHTDLKEALVTTATENGVIIGEWEISKEDKRYSVTNINSDYPIAYDLVLYEAAHALAKCLNNGKSITHPDIKSVIRLEEEFSKHFSDAIHYKRQLKNSDGNKQFIAEARYSDAKSKMISIKQELKKITR